jgi:hypothetical protein
MLDLETPYILRERFARSGHLVFCYEWRELEP